MLRDHFFVPDGISAEAQCAQADALRRDTRNTPRSSTVHHHGFTESCLDHVHNEYEPIGDNK